jgi:hypothetical protein
MTMRRLSGRRILRIASRGAAALGTALVVVLAAWMIVERARDPLRALDRMPARVTEKSRQTYARTTGDREPRLYQDVVLATDRIGDVRFTVSLPAEWTRPAPVVLIVGGLEIGRQSLDYVRHHGANALIGYEYPYAPEYWYEGAPLREIPAIRRAVLDVPSQLVVVLQWAKRQAWCDATRVTALGYSFGALFLPAFYRLAPSHGLELEKGILAYGGVDCELLLRENLGFGAKWKRALVALLAATAIHPIEPALHVPHLEQEMLLINGRRDTLIPAASWQRLHALKPEPKDIVLLEAGHMHPGKPDLTARVVETSRAWLLERGIIEP